MGLRMRCPRGAVSRSLMADPISLHHASSKVADTLHAVSCPPLKARYEGDACTSVFSGPASEPTGAFGTIIDTLISLLVGGSGGSRQQGRRVPRYRFGAQHRETAGPTSSSTARHRAAWPCARSCSLASWLSVDVHAVYGVRPAGCGSCGIVQHAHAWWSRVPTRRAVARHGSRGHARDTTAQGVDYSSSCNVMPPGLMKMWGACFVWGGGEQASRREAYRYKVGRGSKGRYPQQLEPPTRTTTAATTTTRVATPDKVATTTINSRHRPHRAPTTSTSGNLPIPSRRDKSPHHTTDTHPQTPTYSTTTMRLLFLVFLAITAIAVASRHEVRQRPQRVRISQRPGVGKVYVAGPARAPAAAASGASSTSDSGPAAPRPDAISG